MEAVRLIAGRDRLCAVSLFSGAGGMDIGVEAAGFDILAAVEIDPYCCETLRLNIERRQEETAVVEEDIREVDPADLMKSLRLRPGELDLLIGGPPCQTFSLIGKKAGLGDERGLLIFQMTRFARVFRPRAVLVEQVKGILGAQDLHGVRGGVFDMLLREFDDLGYVPKWRVINSADYGVPQLRERVFVVATPMPNGFEFPEPTHGPPRVQADLFPLRPYRTVGEALKGLGRPSRKSVNAPLREDSHVDVTTDRDRERIEFVPEGSYLACQTHLPKSITGNLGPKDTTKYLRLKRTEPSKTLRCGEIFFHPTVSRILTPREYMRLHGYPDDYYLKGPIRSRSGRVPNLDQHRQVANSVPPPVAEVLATAIREVL